jgi:transcriptional regulator with PAS, ATPase and Fis domain
MKDKTDSIKKSHMRSQEFGLESSHIFPRQQLSDSELKIHLKKHDGFLGIAEPFLQQLYEIVSGSGFFINLTDSNGCILSIYGDREVLDEAEKLKMVPGAYMNESSIGTNSMGLVLKEKKPVQVTSKEHFISAYYKWTCSAAPIKYNEEILGCINMTGHAENVHPHSLGMVVSAAKAIENKIKALDSIQQLETSNQFAFAMMNNLSFGVMAITIADKIEWVNDTACRMINTRRTDLIQKDITEILPDWKRICRIVLNELLFIDEPAIFDIPHIKERFLFNAFIIRGEKNKMHGYLITFRQFSRVVNLIKKYSGYQTRFTFDSMFALSPSMVKLKQQAQRIAKESSTVLLTGESGTGKEVVAQSIHNASLRRDAPFIALNCGAMAESLIESELFGYEDGAYTGAKRGGAPGKFELANHGTLFLDEIGEMSADMQVRLLRSIQEGSVTRIGGEKEIKLDVRIIAATNKNLEEEIKNGKFRLDLYYRLNVIHLKIPPLRKRKEDILPMARFFALQKAEKTRRPMPFISSEFEEYLLNCKWPGNVRELENVIERFVVMEGDYSFMDGAKSKLTVKNESGTNSDLLGKSLAEIENIAILSCLKLHDNNMSKAAKNLGISRNTLYQKLKKIQE